MTETRQVETGPTDDVDEAPTDGEGTGGTLRRSRWRALPGAVGRAVVAPWRRLGRWADASTGRTRRRVLWALAAVLVVVVAVGTVFGVLAHLQTAQANDESAASQAARTRGAAALTFRAGQLDQDLATAKEGTTGRFAAQYDQIAVQLLDTVGRQSSTSVVTTFDRSGVVGTSSDGDGDHVTVLLFGHQAVGSPATPTPRTSAVQIQVTMTEAAGQWLVSDLRAY